MIDAFHIVYDNINATEMAIKSFRQYNPDSSYIVIGDGGANHYDLCKKYNCTYLHSQYNIGYPSIPSGYNKEKILEYLRRIFSAANMCKGSHMMIMEDDVCIINPMHVSHDDEMLIPVAGLANQIHEKVLNKIIENVKEPIDDYYGMGGGGIFKRKSFIQAYEKFYEFIDNNFDELHKIYPPLGWPDCILSLSMMSIGKRHKVNKELHELGYWKMDFSKVKWEGIEEQCKPYCSILHHFKKYYNKLNY